MSAGPMCCGTPMVHNSWTEEYECADAYFYLLDEGVIGESATLISDEDCLTDYERERYEHWRVSRMAAFVSRYASRRDPSVHVEAVQLTDAADWEAIARWCGGSLRNHEIGGSGEHETTLQIPGGVRAGLDDWIVKVLDDLGLVLVWLPEEFAVLYSPLTPDFNSTSPRS